MKKVIILMCLFIGYNVIGAFGQIDSQWRGPNRDGIYPNETLLKEWPVEGPKLLWSADGLGQGFSSAAVTSDRVYVTGMINETGTLFAFDMNGKLVWKSTYGPEWTGQHPGVRTTPTVVGDRIYVISTHGRVVCFDIQGKTVWSVDTIKAFGARVIEWGITESLLIDGDRLFCTPGGSNVTMAALDRHTGKTLWTVKGNGEKSGYCSPCLIKHGNRRLILTMTARSVIGIDADTGEYLWRQSHVTSYDVNANTPLYHDGTILTVSGYGTGCQMFRLTDDGKGISKVWAEKTLDSQMGSVILLDGVIYGSGHNKRRWHCLDWKTGEIQFSERAIGNKGNIIYSDGMLYCYSERGDVAIVKPNPEKFEVVSSFKIEKGSGTHWAHPVIKNGRLYIRHGDVLMVYHVSR